MRATPLILLLWTAAVTGGEVPASTAVPSAAIGCPMPAPPELELPGPALSLPLGDALADLDDDTIDIVTSGVEVALNGAAVFDNRLVLRQGDRQLGADRGRYDRATGEMAAEGNVEFRNDSTWVRSNAARYNATTGLFSMEGAEYELFTVPARGSAEHIALEEARELTLDNVTYTTCARGKDDWLLRAGSLSVNRETGVGTARNARLEFMGVPIIYAPYLTYPVDNRRKSGLLLPDFGNSSQRGVELELPYYFNLAPNYDATLTPHYMSRRGIQAEGEVRYLGEYTSGVLRGTFLPDDDVTDTNRGLISWFHRSRLPGNWRSTIDASDVTDSAYFEDLGSGLAQTSQTHLRRRLDLEFFNETWYSLFRIEDYETLDEAIAPEDEPYRRVPQFSVRGFWPDVPLGFEVGVDSQFTYFDRSAGVTGFRAHLQPEVSLPLQFGPISLEPYAALDYTAYNLRGEAPDADETPKRTVPVYSVDLETVLERVWGEGGKWLQTIEPRIQYVHIPFEDQSDLPVFDTIAPAFDLVQLFRKNRYVGLDRLGDTDQLNFGLTTRLMRSEDGSQFLTATIGETQYLSSRDVVLPGELPSDDGASDYVAELGLNFNNVWNVDLGYQWDSDQHVTQLAEARILYRPDEYRVLHLSYRFRRDSIREIDVAGAWPITDRLSVVGRFDYSLEDNQALERFVGLEYSNCCWGVRLAVRRNLSSRDGDSDSAVTLQLLLKGFGSPGSPAERLLDRGILGYDRFDQY